MSEVGAYLDDVALGKVLRPRFEECNYDYQVLHRRAFPDPECAIDIDLYKLGHTIITFDLSRNDSGLPTPNFSGKFSINGQFAQALNENIIAICIGYDRKKLSIDSTSNVKITA